MSNDSRWKPYVILFALALIAYWPIVFGVFSLKNDALIYFLPWRFHVSEAIQAGHFPFWSPYLYNGMPLYNDMQSGSWNPLVLFISLFTRYNMQVLELELFLYFFISAIGIYKLTRRYGINSPTAIICSVAYMCCGFMTDSSSFIPWITSAAWLPFVFLFFARTLATPNFYNATGLGFFLFLLLTAGYPVYFIFAAYILLAGLLYFIVQERKQKTFLKTLGYLALSALVFILLSFPAIYSFWEFLPYYERGSGTSLSQALVNPFPAMATLSYITPGAVVPPHRLLHADLAMRNAYTGIFLLLFFFAALQGKFSSRKIFILSVALFCFLFSLGDATPVRQICYKLLPLMDSFRHPGIIRIFTTLLLIMLAAPAMNHWYVSRDWKTIKIPFYVLSMICLILIVWGALNGGLHIPTHDPLHNFSRANFLVIQGLIQLIFLTIFYLIKKKQFILTSLIIFNSILFTWMSLPFTSISQMKTRDVDHYLASFPKGFPLPDVHRPIHAAQYSTTSTDTAFGYTPFYSKTLEIQDNIVSPTVKKEYLNFLANKSLRDSLDKSSFVMINEGNATANMQAFGSDKLTIQVNVDTTTWLTIFQQWHPNWKAWIDGKLVTIDHAKISPFMSVQVNGGNHELSFRFKPPVLLLMSMYVSFACFLATIFYLVYYQWRKRKSATVDHGHI